MPRAVADSGPEERTQKELKTGSRKNKGGQQTRDTSYRAATRPIPVAPKADPPKMAGKRTQELCWAPRVGAEFETLVLVIF